MSSAPSLFPAELRQAEDVEITLGSGRPVELHLYRVDFNICNERLLIALDKAYSARPLVLVEKQAAFPEIALLGLFQKSGWQGAWVDLLHRKFFDKMPNISKGISLSTHANQVLARVTESNGSSRSGVWDLILWRDRTVVFIRVIDRDTDITADESHARWLAAGVRAGLSPSQFVVVQWGYRSVVARRKTHPPAGGTQITPPA
jgi:hypothetical protein